MAYNMYIYGIAVPVMPETIQTSYGNRNETYHLINDGEVNIPKKAGLISASFKLLLPNTQYPFGYYPNGFHRADWYIHQFKALKENQTVFQWIVSRAYPTGKTLYNTNITMVMEDFKIVDDAKAEGFDMLVEIKLKEYKSFSTKTFSVSLPSATAPIAINEKRPQSTTPPANQNTGGGGGSTGGGGGGGTTYKVQIPGMAVVSVKASSVQGAITAAMGTNWTGDVVVNGTTYYVVKGVISQRPTTKSTTTTNSSVKKAVENVKNAVKNTVKNVVNTAKNVANKVVNALKNAATTAKTTTVTAKKPTTVPKPSAARTNKKSMIQAK